MKRQERDVHTELATYVGDKVYEKTHSECFALLAALGTDLGTRIGTNLLQSIAQEWLRSLQTEPRKPTTVYYGFTPTPSTSSFGTVF